MSNGADPGREISVSFELFPPKTEKGQASMDAAVDRLSAFAPEYFSVTYGAGGSTRAKTRETVDRVHARTGLPVAHHLTCVEASRDEIDELARGLWEAGIRKLVALRGDPPAGGAYEPRPDGYAFAPDLVEGLKKIADFDIAVAAYPEVHPQALNAESDLDNLKRKLDAGANKAITQYAFDTDAVLRFIDRARAAGVDKPIVPGIMPVAHFGKLKAFSENCGAVIPDWLAEMFDGLDDDPSTRSMVAAAVATEQCRRLIEAGITEFHVYTLNKADVSVALCRALGLREQDAARTAA
ncbi:MAG: methylenetetrahydrofolate reductase [NAD(P)H] [Pseudomonadota bacterium]